MQVSGAVKDIFTAVPRLFQSENSFYINWETKNSILNIELTFIETTYQMVHNQFNLEEFGL